MEVTKTQTAGLKIQRAYYIHTDAKGEEPIETPHAPCPVVCQNTPGTELDASRLVILKESYDPNLIPVSRFFENSDRPTPEDLLDLWGETLKQHGLEDLAYEFQNRPLETLSPLCREINTMDFEEVKDEQIGIFALSYAMMLRENTDPEILDSFSRDYRYLAISNLPTSDYAVGMIELIRQGNSSETIKLYSSSVVSLENYGDPTDHFIDTFIELAKNSNGKNEHADVLTGYFNATLDIFNSISKHSESTSEDGLYSGTTLTEEHEQKEEAVEAFSTEATALYNSRQMVQLRTLYENAARIHGKEFSLVA